VVLSQLIPATAELVALTATALALVGYAALVLVVDAVENTISAVLAVRRAHMIPVIDAINRCYYMYCT
jgi:hypothetical protein